MSELKDRLRTDLTAAMKSRDSLRSSTLRLLLSAVTTAEVAGKQQRELGDDEVVAVLGTEAKKRREAAAAFADAGRAESAEKERAEAAIIAGYLPDQLDDAEIEALVSETVAELGVAGDGPRAMGRVMGALQAKVRGRADGAAVAAAVRRQLG
ncbi:MAG: GatB/YqeY domain-containing protein [Nocardioidaceae bacterium]